MGTFKDEAKPFVRPTKKNNQKKANKLFEQNYNKEMAKE